ncbi:MAG: transglycosylase SLT domain-containing protein, partial [Cyclobacteriaceae bacterium]|nr:transglycosylase SLT domain-containing protein [Cyclobacteriaceae bacterium HetDA_MAG_MS6]
MRFIFYWLVIFFAYPFVYGQIPQVPNQMDFAGMKLFLTEGAKRDIQKDVNALRASEKFFKLELDKANLYFPIISRVLKESGVPEDFKYLALQESDLIADAVSSANAVGFWQFKDFTAREVGLRVDKKVDERKNLVSSTEGAAKYLKRNNFQFSNWAYALSAYQAGPGGVQKYIDQKYLGKDKFTVTKKSHWYLKRFLAHKIAYQNEIGIPHSKGIVLLEYTKGQNKTLEQVAKELKVDINVLKEYNKWLLHGRIPDDKRYAVIYPGTNLPREGNTIASKKSDQEPSDPIVPTIQYPETLGPTVAESKNIAKINGIKTIVAKEDDSSSSLALAAGIGEQAFLGYNDLEEGQGIIPGQFYYIAPKKSGSKLGFHIAAWDDTLWGVSQRYGIKLRKLASKNRMSMTDEIKPGRVLWLKSKRPKNVDIEYHDLPPKSKPKIIAEKKSPKPVVSPQKSP